MKAAETHPWAFAAPPSDDCEVQCPDAECGAWSALAAWRVDVEECETCDEHEYMVCPVCHEGQGERHLSGPLFQVRARPVNFSHV